MSTNSECRLVETKPSRWFYILEDRNAPKNAWDWMEYARAYGPFKTEALALKHLDDNHANPGGYCEIDAEDLSDTAQELISDATI